MRWFVVILHPKRVQQTPLLTTDQPTTAECESLFNVADGVIIATNLINRKQLPDTDGEIPFPENHEWWDIVMQQWIMLHKSIERPGMLSAELMPVLANPKIAERGFEGVVAGRTPSKYRVPASFYTEVSKSISEGKMASFLNYVV